MNTRRRPPDVRRMLLDDEVPIELRRQLLLQLCRDEGERSAEVLAEILAAAASGSGDLLRREKREEIDTLLEELKQGPLRSATFVQPLPREESTRALVVLDDGTSAYVSVPDPELTGTLRCGEAVLLDGQARAVLGRASRFPLAGEAARLERVLDGGRVEVSLHDHDRFVFRAAASLTEGIEGGEVEAGAALLVCPRRAMAFEALPPPEGRGRFRFLSHEPVPDVVVSRDLGAPPEYIEELADTVRLEMTNPGSGQRWRLRSVETRLLAGSVVRERPTASWLCGAASTR